MRHALKPKTPSGAARFNYINRSGKYERDKDDLVFAADCNMPDFAKHNALIFWENADEHERSDARICLELELNLPSELKTVEQQIAVVEIYIKQLNERAGRFPISYAIHSDKSGTNPHVHLMLSERTLDGIERPAEQYFKRGNSKNPERGGAIKSRWWHDKQNVFWSRAAWAESCNQVLIANGFDARFDPRTKLAQRAEAIEQGDLRRAVSLSTLTETHEGPHVGGIRKRLEAGRLTRDEVDAEILEKLDSNDTIKDFNRELKLFAEVADIEQLQAFLECEKPVERMAFLADLYTQTPTPAAELAVEPEDLEYDYEREPRQNTETVSAYAGSVQEHIEYLHVVQSRENNQLLQDTISRSEQSQIQGRAGSLLDTRDAVRPAAQPLDTASSRAVRDVRSAEPVSLADYQRAEHEACDAELAEDFASQDLGLLKDRESQLTQIIEEAEPNWLERIFIKVGLIEDKSLDLKKQVPALLKQITETEKEVRRLGDRASELRADAERLQTKLDALRVSEPKVTPAQTQTMSADFAKHLEKLKTEAADAKVESKRQSPQAQDSAKRPRRGPRL